MAGRRIAAGLALAALGLTTAGCSLGGSTKTVVVHHTRTVTTTVTVTTTPTTTSTLPAAACTGSRLSGTFSLVPGSAAAGQISYVLVLKNTSSSSCTISGRPAAQLLGAGGAPLPTHITADGAAGGSPVVLAQNATVQAQGRFSPDVPGQGDSQSGPCQPKAYTLQVTPDGGGTVAAPVAPPTRVCEQGTIAFSAYR